MAEEEDRISSLPDCLLLEIISRIKIKTDVPSYLLKEGEEEILMSTKETIRTTATISKRWNTLWTKLPNLDFSVCDFTCIDKTLSQCPTSVNLNKFKLHIYYDTQDDAPTSTQFKSWIHHAITRNVQEVDLLTRATTWEEFSYDDDLFFNNSCFRIMKIRRGVFNPPKGTIRWDKLKFLCIEKGKLVDESFGKILSGSPCLETLKLDGCYGVRRIDATSKRFKNLVLTNYGERYRDTEYIDTIRINAPYMLSLTINGKLYLENLLLLNVSSLVKTDLYYRVSWHFAKTLARTQNDIEEKLLRGILPSLGHVNEITLGLFNYLTLRHLRAEGFQFYKVGADADEDRIPELIASGRTKLAPIRSGGGGVAVPAATETKKEEKFEDKEEFDFEMGFNLFD